MNKSVLGYIVGTRLNINFNPSMGIFFEGKYTGVNFKDIHGKIRVTTDGTSEEREGTVYYYEINASIYIDHHSYSGWYPVLDVMENPSPSAINLRKVKFNFSGFYLGAGLFFSF